VRFQEVSCLSTSCQQGLSSSPAQGEGGGYQQRSSHPRQESGFTLIELMIAAGIVAILAAIALPTYTQYTKRSYRGDAKTALLNNAQYLERNFTQSNCYHQYDSDNNGSCDTAVTLPNTQSPLQGDAVYAISATTLTATTYTLTATPINPGPMAGDACGNLTINHLGVKGVSGDADGNGTAGGASDIVACWNK